MYPFILLLLLLSLLLPSLLSIERDFWCGQRTCYEALELDRSATLSDVRKNYKALSLKYHPDKQTDNIEEFRDLYLHIRNAYDVLSDEVARKEYDDVLDHPELYIQNYAKFYVRYYQVDAINVLMGLLIVSTILDYLYRIKAHNDLVKRVYTYPRFEPLLRKLKLEKLEILIDEYNIKEKELAKDKDKKKKKTKRPDINDVPNSEIPLSALGVALKGNYSTLPTYYDLLPLRMIYWPYYIYKFIYFYVRWLIVFTIQKKPYGPEEREYLTRCALDISQNTWDSVVEAEQKADLIEKELWKPKNMKLFQLDMRRENSTKIKQDRKKAAKRGDDYEDFVD